MGIALTNNPASNTAAVVTIAALDASTTTNVCVEVTDITFGYDTTPTAGSLLIQTGGRTIFNIPVTSAGIGPFQQQGTIKGDAGKNLVITLAAGGGGVTGSLAVLQR